MKANHGKILSLSILLSTVAAGVIYWQMADQDKTAAPSPMISERVDHITSRKPSASSKVGDHWNSGKAKATSSSTNTATENSEYTSFGFSLDKIYQAIGEIEIEADKIVTDEQTKDLLEQAWRKLGPDLQDAELSEVTSLIKQSLPEPFGDQASSILTDYYQYKKVEAAILEEDKSMPEIARVEKLAKLRRQKLGGAMANEFYGDEEALIRFYNEARKIHDNEDLTEQQLSQRTANLKSDLDSGYLHLGSSSNEGISEMKKQFSQLEKQGASQTFIDDIKDRNITLMAAHKAIEDNAENEDFGLRLGRFRREQTQILGASLVESDKLEQIQQIISTYFSEKELALASHYKAPSRQQTGD